MAAQAILQYRNTHIQGIGLSLAQLLFHRRLRNLIQSHPHLYKPHPEWIAAAQKREKYYPNAMQTSSKSTIVLHMPYPLLRKGDTVSIQNPNSYRWDIAGRIVETLPTANIELELQIR